MKTARSAYALSAIVFAAIVVGGCSADEATSSSTSTSTSAAPGTSATTTTTSAQAAPPATVDDPLSVTCGQFTKLDKAAQLQVIQAIFGDDPAKNDDQVSLADLLCLSDYVQDKPVKDALPKP
ncbi:hypothetical protein IU501_18645 [Nocardia otitidiscaviarum]|uniref:hypothetical protein n=1 Tax=Nocardia otitidiscaviarum TaxID=1823 RepID=UPI0011DCAD79|nr:hypothetical protein [Nocardia otitidiscaviarum]MBF6135014.1 hypothetical protein [Nocardia otitidiscaviarum]MBF6485383.1 hypothetical protein [Nocardia otitidiscaviarum]